MFPQTLRSALRFRVPVRILFLVGAAVLLAIGAPALISSAAPPAAQEKGIARARNSSHAMLSSTGWSALDFGVNAGIAAVAASTTHVYVSGGTLTQVCGNVTCNSGNTTTRGIARWDGNNWSPLGDGVNGGVTAIAVSGSDVYAGGKFTQVCPDAACSPGGTTVNNIARWNGSAWSPLNFGVNGEVFAIAVSGSNVYVGGKFTQVCDNASCTGNTLTVNGIAKWDGTNWTALGNGLALIDNGVNAIAISGNDVYVGGNFAAVCGNVACSSGNTTVNNTAKWNGTSWSALGNGVNDQVYALAFNGGELYVGGWFTHACGNSACSSGNIQVNYIAKWSGAPGNWSALGGGRSNVVEAIDVNGGDVYVGGRFTESNHIAKWSPATNSWSWLGYGVSDWIYDLAFLNNEMYVGGVFSQACGDATCTAAGVAVNFVASYSPLLNTPTPTATATPPPTATHPPTATPTGTLPATATPPPTATNPPTATPTGTLPATATATLPATATATPDCASKPARPSLTSPTNNAKTKRKRATLTWNAAACAETYTLIIKDATTGKSVLKQRGLTTLSYKTQALPQKTYKWFVKGCRPAFGCIKSAVWRFTIK